MLTGTDRFLTEQEAESLLGLKKGTLAAARCRRRPHPPFIRVGERHIRYRLCELEAWLESRTVRCPQQQETLV
jgi:predicted DNA-binding transcriptional regulator AlpA